ncbi:MAG TPA: hypothetical protein VNW97_08520 [Candidatus Saccharimonadales bacterium]|jgi:hypothetical protein|nr:hypothetical protein [Candidatus Saccharimonadales bacterium]
MEKTKKLNKLSLNQETLRTLNRAESAVNANNPRTGVKSVCAPVCTPAAV